MKTIKAEAKMEFEFTVGDHITALHGNEYVHMYPNGKAELRRPTVLGGYETLGTTRAIVGKLEINPSFVEVKSENDPTTINNPSGPITINNRFG